MGGSSLLLLLRAMDGKFTHNVAATARHFSYFAQLNVNDNNNNNNNDNDDDNTSGRHQRSEDNEQKPAAPENSATNNAKELIHIVLDAGYVTFVALMNSNTNPYGGLSYLVRSIVSIVQGLKSENTYFKLHVVLDGDPTAQKAKASGRSYEKKQYIFAHEKLECFRRSVDREQLFHNFGKAVDQFNSACFNNKGHLTKEGTKILSDIPNFRGFEIHQAPHEADCQVAHLYDKLRSDSNALVIIISNDHDLILKCPDAQFIINKLVLSKASGPNEETLPGEMRVVDCSYAEKNFKMSRLELLIATAACGNDYFKGIPGIGGKTALTILNEHKKTKEIEHISNFDELHGYITKCIDRFPTMERDQLFRSFYQGLFYSLHRIIYDNKTKGVIAECPNQYTSFNNSIRHFIETPSADQDQLHRQLVTESFCLHPEDEKRIKSWWNKKIVDPQEQHATPAYFFCTRQTASPTVASTTAKVKEEIETFKNEKTSKQIEYCLAQLKDHFSKPIISNMGRIVASVASKLRGAGQLCSNSGMWGPDDEKYRFFAQVEKQLKNIEGFQKECEEEGNTERYTEYRTEVKNLINRSLLGEYTEKEFIEECSEFLSSTTICWVLWKLSTSKKATHKTHKSWSNLLSGILSKFVNAYSQIRDCDWVTTSNFSFDHLASFRSFLLHDHFLLHHFGQRGEPDLSTISGQLIHIFKKIKEFIDMKKIEALCRADYAPDAILSNFVRWRYLLQVITDGNIDVVRRMIADFKSSLGSNLLEAPAEIHFVKVDFSSSCPACAKSNRQIPSCYTCRLLKEMIIEYVWFPDEEERKMRRQRFEDLVFDGHFFSHGRASDCLDGKNAAEKQAIIKKLKPYLIFMYKLEPLVGKGEHFINNVLVNGIDFAGRIISCSNNIIKRKGTNEASPHFSPYHKLKLRLTLDTSFEGTLVEKIRMIAGRAEFHKKQRKLFLFIVKYPLLWRQYVDANVICDEWLTSGEHDGDTVKRPFVSRFENCSACFLTSEEDWNSPKATAEFERFLDDLNNNELDKQEYYNCSTDEFLLKLDNKINNFKTLSRYLEVIEKLEIHDNFPGVKSGDFTFFIQMMIISLKRSSEEVDVEQSLKADDNSDLDYDYPKEFYNDERLGVNKEEFWARIDRLKDTTQPELMQYECPLLACKKRVSVRISSCNS